MQEQKRSLGIGIQVSILRFSKHLKSMMIKKKQKQKKNFKQNPVCPVAVKADTAGQVLIYTEGSVGRQPGFLPSLLTPLTAGMC